MQKPRRPLIRYHGGKWILAPWILSHFPSHRIYVEPFGGAASVLLRKSRSYAEIYNDLDKEVVNLFQIVRDRGDELKEKLYHTPFSRDEYLMAWHPSDDTLEQARRTVIRAFMGFGSAAVTKQRMGKKQSRGGLATTGFRSNSNRSGTTPAHDWKNYPECLEAIIKRLRGVVIENRSAFDVIKAHDSYDTLHYIDPPYPLNVRDKGNDYKYELSDEDHLELLDILCGAKGNVIVSTYQNDLYDRALKNWHKVEKETFADGARPRKEILYINREPNQKDLFLS